MSENKREMVKITIEMPNCEPQVMECHGVALTTLEDVGEKYNASVAVVGNMSIADLRHLKNNIENELAEAVDNSIEECLVKHGCCCGKNILRDFLMDLLGLNKED